MRTFMTTLLGLALLAAAPGAYAAADDITGSWSGSGTVSFASGSTEKARCKASYRKISGLNYAVSATCATGSGKVSETAQLTRQANGSYQGSFVSSQFKTSGSFYITVSGNSQTVVLTSPAGRATIKLKRN